MRKADFSFYFAVKTETSVAAGFAGSRNKLSKKSIDLRYRVLVKYIGLCEVYRPLVKYIAFGEVYRPLVKYIGLW